ncbi:imelysin family protein [Isoalcanivorax beigongshangi]|uniref:Imelysin family protein n=1 Tax=Isoalcanivorax beigongshangi TaxID=3238810 RepID=A0ABV4AJ75_9GAMM
MRAHSGLRWVALLPLAWLAACDPPAPTASEPPLPRPAAAAVESADAELAVADRAFRNARSEVLAALHQQMAPLQAALERLLAQPDAAQLAAARAAWEDSYRAYNQAWPLLATQAQLEPELEAVLQQTDRWPLLPGYVDYVPGWPESGIIYDVSLTMDRRTLLAQQNITDATEVSVGFQVVQLLLFGLADSPRQPQDFRAVTESLPSHQGPVSERPENRRRSYLTVVSRILLDDLRELTRPVLQEEESAHHVGALVRALGRTSVRLARAGSLDAAADLFSGHYLAAESRALIEHSHQQTLAFWLDRDSEASQALWAVLEQTAPVFAAQLSKQWQQAPQDYAALGALLMRPPGRASALSRNG